jgi:hypothetical protein
MNAVLLLLITTLTWKNHLASFARRGVLRNAVQARLVTLLLPPPPTILVDLFSQFAMSKTNLFTIFIKHSIKKRVLFLFFFRYSARKTYELFFKRINTLTDYSYTCLLDDNTKFEFQQWSFENLFSMQFNG